MSRPAVWPRPLIRPVLLTLLIVLPQAARAAGDDYIGGYSFYFFLTMAAFVGLFALPMAFVFLLCRVRDWVEDRLN